MRPCVLGGEEEEEEKEAAEAAEEEKEGEKPAHGAPTSPKLRSHGADRGGKRPTELPLKRNRSRSRRRRKEEKAATCEHLSQLALGDRRRPEPNLSHRTLATAGRTWPTC